MLAALALAPLLVGAGMIVPPLFPSQTTLVTWAPSLPAVAVVILASGAHDLRFAPGVDPDDAPTVVSSRSSTTWDAIPDHPSDATPTVRIEPTASCPVPPALGRTEVPTPAAHIAGTGLGVLPWRRPRLQGRDKEQAQLWRLLCHVEASREPQSVRLDGAPGVGRSALGHWFVRQARSTSGVLAVQCSPGRGLQGLVDTLLQPLGPPGDLDGRRRGLHRLLADTPESLAALDALDTTYEGPRAAGMVLDILHALAQRRTLLVVLDAESGARGLGDLASRWQRVEGPALLVHQGVTPHADLQLEVQPLSDAAVANALHTLLPLHPSLTRALTDAAAGYPTEIMAYLGQMVPSLRLGPHGFELDGPLPSRADQGRPLLARTDITARPALERLAHLDAEVSADLWAQACEVPKEHVVTIAQRLERQRGCEVRQGLVRLAPRLRAALREDAALEERAAEHHRAIARVLERHRALPHRLGQAWVEAGEVARGVGVWLDQWRRLVALQGHRTVEGLLRDAEALIAPLPRCEALHGRLPTILAVVQDRSYAASDPALAIARRDESLARGWYDTACESAYYAVMSTPTGPDRRRVLEEGLAAVDGRASDGPWARLLVTACSASRRWGFAPDGAWMRSARGAVARAEASGSCGHAALITPPLVRRLGPTLDALVATHRGDSEGAVAACLQVVQVSRAHDAATLTADLHDLAAAHVAAGDPASAETVYQEIERLARWTGSLVSEAGVLAQRAGLALLDGRWDRAARLARQAQLGIPAGYPEAMMRLIAAMHMADEGKVAPAVAVVDDEIDHLVVIRPVDRELRTCIEHLLQAMSLAAHPVPDRWRPLLSLIEQ